jgi:dUTP pyrophosphatase
MKVQIINNSKNPLPKYAKPGDAGMDLMADLTGIKEEYMSFSIYDEEAKVITIFPGGRALIPTNIHIAVPEGYELQIRPRSGSALKYGITVLNTPGTIDSGYRNSIGVILINLGEEDFNVNQGDRIAQAVLEAFVSVEWELVEELSDSDRGMGGFGHTGTKEV